MTEARIANEPKKENGSKIIKPIVTKPTLTLFTVPLGSPPSKKDESSATIAHHMHNFLKPIILKKVEFAEKISKTYKTSLHSKPLELTALKKNIIDLEEKPIACLAQLLKHAYFYLKKPLSENSGLKILYASLINCLIQPQCKYYKEMINCLEQTTVASWNKLVNVPNMHEKCILLLTNFLEINLNSKFFEQLKASLDKSAPIAKKMAIAPPTSATPRESKGEIDPIEHDITMPLTLDLDIVLQSAETYEKMCKANPQLAGLDLLLCPAEQLPTDVKNSRKYR